MELGSAEMLVVAPPAELGDQIEAKAAVGQGDGLGGGRAKGGRCGGTGRIGTAFGAVGDIDHAVEVLDSLEDMSGWMPVASGFAELRITPERGPEGPVMRLDFDFKGGAGFVVARKPIVRPMPESYTLSFRIRGAASPNRLELKLADQTGRNVWWRRWEALVPPADWQTMREAYNKASTSRYSNVSIRKGDRVRLVTPGGGGYGDPALRDPEAVAHDVREGYVSKEAARRHYGYQEA